MKSFLITILSLLFLSCQKDYSGYYIYSPPEQTDDGIAVGTLAEVGMDSSLLASAVGGIYANKYDQIHAMLIHKDGRLVF